jgi:hypothetical protein
MATDFRVIDHNIVGDVASQRHNIFVQIVALVGLWTSTNDQAEAVADLDHENLLRRMGSSDIDEDINKFEVYED